MNKSYSKIRHIQETNKILENRILSEKNDKIKPLISEETTTKPTAVLTYQTIPLGTKGGKQLSSKNPTITVVVTGIPGMTEDTTLVKGTFLGEGMQEVPFQTQQNDGKKITATIDGSQLTNSIKVSLGTFITIPPDGNSSNFYLNWDFPTGKSTTNNKFVDASNTGSVSV
jgi:hypothetical protein